MKLITMPTLERDNLYKRDFNRPIEEMSYEAETMPDEYGDLNEEFSTKVRETIVDHKTGRIYDMSDTARKQLHSLVGVPYNFMDKCPAWLRQKNMDFHMNKVFGKELFVRTYDDHYDKGNQVRAFLSDEYAVINYSDALEVVNRAVENGGMKDPMVVRNHYNDGVMRFQVIEKGLEVMDGSFGGFTITNSELGLHKLEAAVSVYTLVCTNGLVVPKTIASFQRRHIGKLNTETLYNGIFNVMSKVTELSNKLSSVMKDSAVRTIKKEDGMNYINNLKNFPVAWRKAMVERMDKVSNFGVYNIWTLLYAMTEEAQKFDESIRKGIEEESGRYMMKLAK